MTPLDDEQITGVLAGMPYPARLWAIVAWAEFNGAWPAALDPLYAIPDREYSGPDDILQAVGTAVHTAVHAADGPDGVTQTCHHRRHPRLCSARRNSAEPLAG